MDCRLKIVIDRGLSKTLHILQPDLGLIQSIDQDGGRWKFGV